MNMTHYMELLADNQPWNLIIFMAIPVILAETVAITELYILYTRKLDTWVRSVNRIAGLVVGVYFTGIIIYLVATAVVPLTRANEWRTVVDVIAVGAYLIGGIPMVLIALQDMNLIHKNVSAERKLGYHAVYVAVFLVFAHIAMIAGMTDPALLGYQGKISTHLMSDQSHSMPLNHQIEGQAKKTRQMTHEANGNGIHQNMMHP